jgi:hypothetical protein
MQSDSQFCTSCNQYKLLHQFKTNHLGAPYKTCLTCCVRSHCEPPVQAMTLLTLSYSQSKKRRRPLEEIDPNVWSLRSATAAPTTLPPSAYPALLPSPATVATPATLPPFACPALLPRPLPCHVPVRRTERAQGSRLYPTFLPTK